MSANENNLDRLINSLSQDLTPVQRLSHPLRRGLVWCAVGALYLAIVSFFTGAHIEFNNVLVDPNFSYEIFSLFVITITAALASFYLCIPNSAEKLWVVTIPFVLGINFIIWLCIMGMGDIYQSSHQEMEWSHCFEEGLLFAGIPATIIIYMSRQGATTRPVLMALTNMLAIASLASIALRLSCGEDTLPHILVFHILPFLLTGALVGFFARKIYKW